MGKLLNPPLIENLAIIMPKLTKIAEQLAFKKLNP